MKKRREEKRGYPIIISKCTVKWSIIRAVQAKPGFLKTWVEFQISGKTWVPCFGKTWVLDERQGVTRKMGWKSCTPRKTQMAYF